MNRLGTTESFDVRAKIGLYIRSGVRPTFFFRAAARFGHVMYKSSLKKYERHFELTTIVFSFSLGFSTWTVFYGRRNELYGTLKTVNDRRTPSVYLRLAYS